MEEYCHGKLHSDEASFLVLYIVNAKWNTEMSEMCHAAKLSEHCVWCGRRSWFI